MTNRYDVFRKMLDFVSEDGTVTDADMNNYAGNILVEGELLDGSTIKIEVTIDKKEAQDEAVS